MGAPTALPPAPPVVDAAESAAEPEDVDVSALPAPELLARVRKLQQDRTATYKQYDEALVACAPGEGRQGDPAAYATVVAKVTVVFDRISKRANACEAALRSRGLSAAADAIRRLQQAEKEKLELTAARHLGAFRPDTDAATAHSNVAHARWRASVNEALEEKVRARPEEGAVCVVRPRAWALVLGAHRQAARRASWSRHRRDGGDRLAGMAWRGAR